MGAGRGPEPPKRNGHTYFKLVEKAGRGDRVQGRLDVALFSDDAPKVRRALAEVPGAALGDDVEVRIRGRVARATRRRASTSW